MEPCIFVHKFQENEFIFVTSLQRGLYLCNTMWLTGRSETEQLNLVLDTPLQSYANRVRICRNFFSGVRCEFRSQVLLKSDILSCSLSQHWRFVGQHISPLILAIAFRLLTKQYQHQTYNILPNFSSFQWLIRKCFNSSPTAVILLYLQSHQIIPLLHTKQRLKSLIDHEPTRLSK
jgi:hypothetical protein